MVDSKLDLLAKANERFLSWMLFGPKLLFRLPRNRTMTYRFRFQVKNPTDETLRVKIQLESPSPILVFQEAKSKHMSRSRLYSKITSLGRARERKIPPGQEKIFDFPADYAPYLTRNLPSVLVLYFGIFVFDLKDQIKMRIGPRKINLPISEQGSKTVSVDDYVL